MTDAGSLDPRTEALRREITHLHASLGELQDALRGVNDVDLRDAFQPTLEVGYAVVALHEATVSPSIADDVANLRAALRLHRVPREDPDLGPLDSLRQLRGARATVIADTEAVLVAADELGLRPAELGFVPPTEIQFERAGLEGMLSGLEKRLGEVEQAVRKIEDEGKGGEGASVQQVGIVNFFVRSMDVEIALARLEASARELLDFAALGRAVETMSELTRDFVATVKAVPRLFSEAVSVGAGFIRKGVGRVASGLRAIVHRVARRPAEGIPAPGTVSAAAEPSSRANYGDFWQGIEEGDFAVAHGDLRAARERYSASLTVAQEQSRLKPDDRRWQRNVGVAYNRLGDVERAAGNLGAVRARYEAALAIADRLAEDEPDNAEWQRDLSVSFNKLGDVEVASGNLGVARQRYEAGLAIRDRLAKEESDNTRRQRDLSVSYSKLGDVEMDSGNLGAARERHEAGLAIRDRLAQQEPDNTEWQRDLSISYERLGDIEVESRNLGAARERYEAGLAIRDRLAQQEPGNTNWQRDLSVILNKLGDIEFVSSELGAARQRFEAGLAITARLAKQEPSNADWQRDLSVSYNKLGDVEIESGDLGAARERYEAGLAIRERLAKQEPGNSQWQRDLSVIYDRLGDVERTSGDFGAARVRFEEALAITDRLTKQEPGNSEWQRDLSISYLGLAQLAQAEGRAAEVLHLLGLAEGVMAALADARPDHPGFARDLAQIRGEIHRLQD